MSDVSIRTEGRAGRITLNRPQALNALTPAMCGAIDAAFRDWRDDPAVAVVLIDAMGERAFCAGGDIAEVYRTGIAGDYAMPRAFWREEYRMNARIDEYPKPVVSFLQGYTMGGGVGLGCHASHRIVGESSKIAMPECTIGLAPDVGGSFILARANGLRPGFGSWIGATGLRLGPGDAILAGFADAFAPEESWPALKARVVETGAPPEDLSPPPEAGILADLERMSAHFERSAPADIVASLATDESDAARAALAAIRHNAPLATAAHLELLRRLGPTPTLRDALRAEYRYTWRSIAQGDFLEGIRALIIDKDRTPRWRHARIEDVTADEVAAMLAPLGTDELTFDGEEERA
jgi:enoyl-CoA hydratase/carnithine racemase